MSFSLLFVWVVVNLFQVSGMETVRYFLQFLQIIEFYIMLKERALYTGFLEKKYRF